ncbi:hypothetical protein DAPPUDRAFT_266212 [Daphnia pulex]|uniref:Uncharacterized protein n=1 Tax=Daphnia pulex TaxID=6669 RepID=E9HUN6_DAPPU|nr:hypothetical protein DAPPUDRAFT_266212 [Daphnia pulex]|eukprot:EFX64545.1 hypothetical protein DAPPUDRAFT_266212 [Daphnia pulex]
MRQQLADITGADDAGNETRAMSTSSAPSGFMRRRTLLSSIFNRPAPLCQPPPAENVQTTNTAGHVPVAPATAFHRTMTTPAGRPSTLSTPLIGSTQKLLPPARLFATPVPPISTAPSTPKPGIFSQMRDLATRVFTPSSRTMTRYSSVPTLPVSSNVSTVLTTSVTNPTFIPPSSTTNFVTPPTTSFVTPPTTSYVTPPTTTNQPVSAAATQPSSNVSTDPSQDPIQPPASFPPSTSFSVPWQSWRNAGRATSGVNVPPPQPTTSTVVSSRTTHTNPPGFVPPSTAVSFPIPSSVGATYFHTGHGSSSGFVPP